MLRMSASTAAPIPAHDPPHFRRHDCRRSRRLARHGASHRCPRSRRRSRPLNRRDGSPPPGSPASISRSPVQRESGFRPAGAGFGSTPHASMMQRAHARAERALRHCLAAFGRLPASASCWIERVSVRYTRLVMNAGWPWRHLSPTDTRTDIRVLRWTCAAGARAGARPAQSGASPRSDSWKARASATSASSSSWRPSWTIASRLSVARNQV